MTQRGKTEEIRKLRTELAWLCGDARHGGPPREQEIAELRERLRLLLEGDGNDGRTAAR